MESWSKEKLLNDYCQLPADQLVSTLAHDVRNRLSLIAGYADFLSKDLNNPEQMDIDMAKEFISQIIKGVSAITAVIDAGLETDLSNQRNKPSS